jgi:hypothetical protein
VGNGQRNNQVAPAATTASRNSQSAMPGPSGLQSGRRQPPIEFEAWNAIRYRHRIFLQVKQSYKLSDKIFQT